MHIEGSCIEKCSHGIYLASKEEVKTERAHFCSFCRPAMDNKEPSPLEWRDLVAANPVLTRVGGVSCPKCGSNAHTVEGKNWRCADCDNEWRPPRGFRNSKALASVRRID